MACAVRMHETANFTLGSGVTHNNGYGIRHKGKYVRFRTKEASTAEFKRIWREGYHSLMPTPYIAKRYSGNDRSKAWFSNVMSFYWNECNISLTMST